MAAASYTTDLTALSTAQATTGWAEPGTWTAGGTPALEADYFINGGACISKTFNAANGIGGLVYTAGAGVTIPTDGAFLAWVYYAAPNALFPASSGGIRLVVGSSTTAFKAWTLGGSDTYQYGGWLNLPVDPTLTADYTVGTPTATLLTFGWVANNNNAVQKGNPFACGVIRYGRCEARINGGDLANGYATFAGYATQNDANANRWGLIQAVNGGYLWKGLMTLGYTSAVDFRDSNTQILVDNTTKVSANFNKIEIRQAGSRVDWTGISFLALGSVSKGRLQVVDDADVNIDACSFTGMDTLIFRAASSVNDSVFRRCGIVTPGGGAFDGCTWDRATGTTAVQAAAPVHVEGITNASFVSDGTGYAIEIQGTAANITLTNVNFSGYATSNGSTGNEAIFVNIASGSMSVTISGGTVPSIRTAGATVTVVAGAVTASLTVTNDTGTPIQNAQVLVAAASGGPLPYLATVTIANSGTTATVTHTGHGLATNDKVLIKGASHAANRGVFTITVTNANAYTYTMGSAPGSNPTGTITSTFVVLSGVTNASGVISMSRVFSADQPVSGWARKSTSSPYYKTGPVNGTVDSATGATLSALLIADE
jgi:hypothetical protein